MIPLEDIESEFGTVTIAKDPANGALIYKVGGRQQGAIDEGGTSLAYYIHAFFSLLTQAKARNILMIGGAGCTLGTLLSRAQSRVTIVDVNPACFVVAQKHFSLPGSVICHVAEGEAFVRGDTGLYDAIVIDAFHGDFVPSHLKSPEFFALARDRLAPDGAVFVNVLVQNDFDDCADRLAKAMKSVWPEVRVLDTPGKRDRNAIVMAGRVAGLAEPELLVRPQINAKPIKTELGRLQFRPWKASRWQ